MFYNARGQFRIRRDLVKKVPKFVLRAQEMGIYFGEVSLIQLNAALLASLLVHSPLAQGEILGAESLPLPPVVSFKKEAQGTPAEATWDLSKIKKFSNGDLVFIRSTSGQSKALEEVTRSHWTHVGVLFRTKYVKSSWVLFPSDSKEGEWNVLEAGSVVKFTPIKNFVGSRAFAIKRMKKPLVEPIATRIFKAGLERVGKKYDTFFLLTADGKTKDDTDYCSELVWYVFSKGAKILLGELVLNGELLGDPTKAGVETQKLLKKRFGSGKAPVDFETWKKQYVIPPQSQFDSPLLERVNS